MKRYLPFLIVTAVAVITVAGGTLFYRAKRPVATVIPADRKADTAESVHAVGPADAAVTLEEFGDFQCPPCGMLAAPLNQFSRDFPRLRIVFKNFPLAMHVHANDAALAAEAAGLQGQFWKMHDVLFHEQNIWGKATDPHPLFNAYAAMLKCNVDRFKKDMASEQLSARVKADQSEGSKLGVTNTPTIFINNTVVPSTSLAPNDLRGLIETAMKEARPSAAGK